MVAQGTIRKRLGIIVIFLRNKENPFAGLRNALNFHFTEQTKGIFLYSINLLRSVLIGFIRVEFFYVSFNAVSGGSDWAGGFHLIGYGSRSI